MQAFIDACASGALPAEIVLVLSNNPEAAGLRRAAAAGVATACINHREFPDRDSFDRALVAELEARTPDLVLSLIHISEPTRLLRRSRMPSSA